MFNKKQKLARRTHNMSGSVIREILKVTQRPEVISLAGGLPSSEAFPQEIMSELHEQALKNYGSDIFQYGTTEGLPQLREAIADYVRHCGIETVPQDVYITTGSQGALDLIGKVLLDPGDYVAMESPTYMGAMTAFNPYKPRYLNIPIDDQGVIPDGLEALFKQYKIKFVYLNPTFQNPTGLTLSLERRKVIAKLLEAYDVLMVEDDPYSQLRYRGDPVVSIKSLASDHVIYTGTMSKIFVPGLRVGYVIVEREIGEWITFAKQGVDLHTPIYSQAIASAYLAGGYHQRHLPKIIEIYKRRQEALLQALDKYIGSDSGFRWTRPDGGMFIWLEGPEGFDSEKAYWEAVKHNVAFVPGRYFFTDCNLGTSAMRLNFTNADEVALEVAVKRLSEILVRRV